VVFVATFRCKVVQFGGFSTFVISSQHEDHVGAHNLVGEQVEHHLTSKIASIDKIAQKKHRLGVVNLIHHVNEIKILSVHISNHSEWSL